VILCQFNENRLGLVENGFVRDVTSVLDALPTHRYPYPMGDALIGALSELRERISKVAAVAQPTQVSNVALRSPVANPGKIVAAPVNYKKHLEEVVANPALHHQSKLHTQEIHKTGLFLKATSSVIGPSENVVIRHPDRRTDHEVELAVIIGRRSKSVRREEALHFIAGYCIGLDISVRGSEERSLRKSLDTYTVLGPWLVTSDEIPDPGNLDLSITVNGELRQHGNTRDLILGVPELIEFATSFYTLFPGDILLTGTPEGVAPIQPGDVMHARIEGIGEMVVHVRAA
jgi:2-keto-4-pentenoate hydratase/2-oxohepta-3-ene-1,7-dioic acid hydratase in catechol pathway